MDLTPEQMDAAGTYATSVRAAVLNAVAEVSPPGEMDTGTALFVGLDGMLAAMAFTVAASGAAPTVRDRRKLADMLRTGFLKALKDADADLAAISAPPN